MATYSDTHLVLNALVAQSEGKEDITSVSVDNIAAFGDTLLSSAENSSKDIVSEAYSIKDIRQGVYMDGIVSRKKQMLPNLLEVIERRGQLFFFYVII